MFGKLKLKWWIDILAGVLLIAGTTYVVLNNLFHKFDPTKALGYKGKVKFMIWDRFMEYGGRWVLLAVAVYYGLVAIKEGIKKYKESTK